MTTKRFRLIRARASWPRIDKDGRSTRAFAKSCSTPGGLLIYKRLVEPRGRGGGSTTKIDRTDHCPTKRRKPSRHRQKSRRASKNHTLRWPSVWGTSRGAEPRKITLSAGLANGALPRAAEPRKITLSAGLAYGALPLATKADFLAIALVYESGEAQRRVMSNQELSTEAGQLQTRTGKGRSISPSH